MANTDRNSNRDTAIPRPASGLPRPDADAQSSTSNVVHAHGIVPGASSVDTIVQAGTIHIHEAAARAGAPHQLPLPPRYFTDRTEKLSALRSLLTPKERTESAFTAAPDRPPLAVISGPAGVGKSVLATVALHHAQSAFPDGALYADLKGFTDAAPADPASVLEGFLRALGTSSDAIPSDAAERAALFRSLTRARRLTVLLDNATSAAQVRHLLPGAAGPVVIATSRYRLSTLIALDGAMPVLLGPLDTAATVGLFTRYLGSERCAQEADALDDLATLTGRLPLAVCAAASRIAQRPAVPVRRAVERLSRAHDRLRSLGGEDVSVHAALETSYEALPVGTRRMYRRLGLHPGAELSVAAASVLTGDRHGAPDRLAAPHAAHSLPAPEEVEEAEDLLYELVEANLLDEVRPGRFRQHDLIRLHAQQRTKRDDAPATATAACRRLAAYYLHTTASAELLLNPHRWRLSELLAADRDALPHVPFANRAEALAWVDSELPSLRALLERLAAEAEHTAVWSLCEALGSTFLYLKNFDTWLWACETGRVAAEADEHTPAQALMITSTATAYLHRQEPDRALHHFDDALQLWARVDHDLGRAAALEGAGVACLARGAPQQARDHFRAAMAIHENLGRARGAALMRRRLGETSRDLGEHEQARAHFHAALDHFNAADEPYMHLRILLGVAENEILTDPPTRFAQARIALDEAVGLSEQIGARAETARIHELRADVAVDEGNSAQVRHHLTRAHELHDELGTPHAAVLRQRLEDLDDTAPDDAQEEP